MAEEYSQRAKDEYQKTREKRLTEFDAQLAIWGLVYMDCKRLVETDVHTALREAGLDFEHNAEVPPSRICANNELEEVAGQLLEPSLRLINLRISAPRYLYSTIVTFLKESRCCPR